jgi:hypothetical protein
VLTLQALNPSAKINNADGIRYFMMVSPKEWKSIGVGVFPYASHLAPVTVHHNEPTAASRCEREMAPPNNNTAGRAGVCG